MPISVAHQCKKQEIKINCVEKVAQKTYQKYTIHQTTQIVVDTESDKTDTVPSKTGNYITNDQLKGILLELFENQQIVTLDRETKLSIIQNTIDKHTTIPPLTAEQPQADTPNVSPVGTPRSKRATKIPRRRNLTTSAPKTEGTHINMGPKTLFEINSAVKTNKGTLISNKDKILKVKHTS